MNKAIITAVAMAFATSAYATDLPSKRAPLAPVAAQAEPVNSLSVSVGPEYTPDSYKKPSNMMYNFSYDRDIGSGVSAGVNFGTTQDYPHGTLTQNIEGKLGYSLPLMASVKARFGVGVGERFTNGANYGYYAFRTGLDYKVTDKITWNAIGYQYRSTFDTGYRSAYENHDVRTGLTYALDSKQAVNVAVYRSFDKDRTKHADGVLVGYAVKF
jgi:hypothetical protein